MDWCIVQVEMPLTRFEKCWPLPTESLHEHPLNLNIVTLTLTFWQINSGVLTSLLLPHLSLSLTDSLPSLNLLCHSKTDARFMQDAPKAVGSIPYFYVAFFPSLKQSFIAYRSSKVSSRPDWIFEIPQLWQSGFRRVYSTWCCSSSFKPEIIRCLAVAYWIFKSLRQFERPEQKKKSGNLLKAPRTKEWNKVPIIYVVPCFTLSFLVCFWWILLAY